MRRSAHLALCLVATLVAACSVAGVADGFATEPRLLATIPAEANVVLPAAFSRDGRCVAYVAWTPEGDYAVCGDWRGKTYAVV